MPHLLHHRRRHSWPYCGPGPRRNVPLMRVTEQQTELEQQFLTPLVSGDYIEDDAASAGIVPPKSTRPHYRIWPHSKSTVEHTIPSTGHSYGSGSGSLRRMIRPPLDKARSLFVLPTTTTAGQNVVISYWVPQKPVMQPAAPDRGRELSSLPKHLAVDRNHRRCHSEQPRSWRRPSASLWTLTEE
ncbi:hypothetical protein BDV33DRAFT_180638 [Aspergillus novoparasiticus]|uniref:Uncharacterized protein n=1 Tax=Aspergillus novoparasiticus TaxID=986946 RepID=A0A5N6EGT3_9EURO|nr:hypothetical protein BDV33DRAFT_180638 [Aspergillus novoparasiticus]